MLDEVYAMGIDLSLRRSGVAFVGIDNDTRAKSIETHSFGREGKRNETIRQRADRLSLLVDEIDGTIGDHMENPQIVCIEDVAFGAGGGSATDRAGLWWMVVSRMLKWGIPVVAVNVAKVKIYATGRGNRLEKDEVMLSIVRRYPGAPIQNNDEADATALALIGARLVGKPFEEKLPQTHLRALEGLVLP